jgi:VanZ family protein
VSRGNARLTWLDGVAFALVAAIAYASLASRGGFDCTGFASTLLLPGRFSGADFAANVLAYALLGGVLALAQAERRRGAGRRGNALAAAALAIAGCSLLSLSLEVAQACIPNRFSSRLDWLANTAGAAAGWLIARALLPAWDHAVRRSTSRDGERRIVAVMLLAVLAWVLTQTAPWTPAGDVGVFRQNAGRLWFAIGAGYLDPWGIARAGGAWLAIAMSLSLPLRSAAVATAAFATLGVAVLALRLLTPGAAPSPELVLTLPAVALAALALNAAAGRRARAAVAVAAALIAVAAYQLKPGYGYPSAFSWSFELLGGHPIQAVRFGAYFTWYALTTVLAGRALGGRAGHWAIGATLAVAATEWAQTAIPGRTPDLSPILVVALAGWIGSRLLAGPGPSGRRLPAGAARGSTLR